MALMQKLFFYTQLVLFLSTAIKSQSVSESHIHLKTELNDNSQIKNIEPAIKNQINSSIKFLDSNLIAEEKFIKESSINQIDRILQVTETPTGSLNNKTSTGVPTPTGSPTDATTAANTTTIAFIYPRCVSGSDCSENGICDLASGRCICNQSFGTLYDNNTATISTLVGANNNNITFYDYTGQKGCNYKKKKQLTAFMLSIFVGFGAEHFYLGRTGIGIAKLVFYIFCGFLNILYLILYKCVPGGEKYVSFIHTYEALYLGCGVGFMLLWNIYDWVNIGYNDLRDEYNIGLAPWGI